MAILFLEKFIFSRSVWFVKRRMLSAKFRSLIIHVFSNASIQNTVLAWIYCGLIRTIIKTKAQPKTIKLFGGFMVEIESYREPSTY